MPIEMIFQLGGEIVFIKVEGSNITFGNVAYGAQTSTIEGLKLNQVGVEKEFPDLKGNPSWREEAIKRFKEKVSGFTTEKERADYIVDDLKKHGYELKRMQKGGHRPTYVR